MNQKNKTAVDLKHSTSNNFGKWGWWIIIYTAILMFLANGCQTDGLNLLVAQFSYVNGWDSNTVLALSTPAGYIALALGVPLGWLIMKKGARKVLVGLLVVGGISYATMGMNASSALYTPILSFLFARFTLGMSLNILGAVTVVVGVITLFFVRDTPEEVGCTPDNEVMDAAQIEANRKEHDNYQSPWTFGKLLRDKDTWMCGLCYGCFMLVTVGIMSQLVARIMERGFAQDYAILCVSACAVIGLFGSYAWGVLDQKLGTKTATVIFGIWYAIAILFNVIPNAICMYISIFMIGVSIGGTANFAPSMTTNIFGRRDFPLAFTVVNTIYNIMRCTSYLVLAATGSYSAAYVVFVLISLIGSLIAWRIDDSEKSSRKTAVRA